MKTFSSEFAHNYETYSFGYCNWALREPNDCLAEFYASGYLPYSGKPDVKDTFYMARSARVDLRRFSLSSENRRVAKRFDGELTRQVIPTDSFDTADPAFMDFCLAYFEERHGAHVMPRERFETILSTKLISYIVSYTKNNKVIAYVFEVDDKDMTHFWYSFYDLSYIKQSLGMWLMLDLLRVAQEENKKHFYIGTVYGEKALYKANFPAFEYWDGNHWIWDVNKLKAQARSDTNIYSQ